MTNRNWERTGGYHGGGGRTSPGIAGVAKYIVLAFILVYVIHIFQYSSGSTVPFKEVEKAVESSLDTEHMKKVDVQGLKRFYGLNGADFEGMLLYTSSGNISAEEVLLIQVKDEAQIKQVRKAIQKRIDNRKSDFEGYAPEQLEQLKQAQISMRGKFIFLAIGKKAAEYKAVFSKSL